jgi:hypothetical protein
MLDDQNDQLQTNRLPHD